ncbi:MAG: hypothetical protein QM489_00105 [Candidatus Izemoplasma sp.]
MGLFEYASNYSETKELHSNPNLQTRYYRNNYKIAKEVLINYAKNNKINIRNINDTHGEIYLQTQKYHVISTIVQITPLETAVELKVQTYYVIGRYRALKIIKKIYNEFDNKLVFKGVSLHP